MYPVPSTPVACLSSAVTWNPPELTIHPTSALRVRKLSLPPKTPAEFVNKVFNCAKSVCLNLK